MPIAATYLSAIQKFEGFTQKAKWDYAQYTNGYGTKALSPTETISKTEAENRFRSEISEALNLVDRFAPELDNGTKAALTSLTFNTGTTWMKSGLGRAIQSGDLDKARAIFVQYNKAGGEVLSGLVARRAAEVTWIGAPSADGADGTRTHSSPATSTSLNWTRNVFDPIGAELNQSVHAPAMISSSQSYFGTMSSQFLMQLSLDVWDFLARADDPQGYGATNDAKSDA